MFNKRRIEALESQAHIHKGYESPTLSVPVVDKDGEAILEWQASYGRSFYSHGGYETEKYKDISFTAVCRALEEMCGVEITYQEIKGSSKVVIYEKDDE